MAASPTIASILVFIKTTSSPANAIAAQLPSHYLGLAPTMARVNTPSGVLFGSREGSRLERLSAADLRRALAFVREMDAVDSPALFPARLLAELRKLMPCDMAGYNEVNPEQQRVAMTLDPETPVKRTFPRVAEQHPVLQYHARTGDGRALRISDFLSQRQFHELELYQESFRLINAEDQIAIALPPTRSSVIGIALNRDRPTFSERDRSLLDVLRPFVAQAYRNAAVRGRLSKTLELLQQQLFEAGNRAAVVINSVRRVAQLTPLAQGCFHRYFGRRIGVGSRLPSALDDWVKLCQSSGDLETRSRFVAPFTVVAGAGCLVIQLVPHGEVGDHDTLLLEEVRDNPRPAAAIEHLSLREYEVLALVAEGKTNPEISSILFISTRTVQKHLEHIYDKLGVRTRAAAAVLLSRLE